MIPFSVGARRIFEKFVSNWRQFLAIHVAVNVFVFILLAPADALAKGVWITCPAG